MKNATKFAACILTLLALPSYAQDDRKVYISWAPKDTPAPIITKLNAAMVAALADPDTRQKLLDLAQVIYPREQQTPEALHAFQKAEIEKWWPIIKAAGIKAE